MSANLPILGLHPDVAEAEGEAFDAALYHFADEALSQNGRASEAIYSPGVPEGLRGKQNKPFDPAPWLDDDGTFAEQLPREDCPCDVLEMFLWTGSERQMVRAMNLLKDRAREIISTDPDIREKAGKAALRAPRSKAFTLAHYAGMAAEVVA